MHPHTTGLILSSGNESTGPLPIINKTEASYHAPMKRIKLKPEIASAHTSANDDPDFTPKGKFAKGNKQGKGNPHAAIVMSLRRLWFEYWDPKKVKAVMDSIYDEATNGNAKVQALVIERLLGKVPIDPSEVDRALMKPDPDERFL